MTLPVTGRIGQELSKLGEVQLGGPMVKDPLPSTAGPIAGIGGGSALPFIAHVYANGGSFKATFPVLKRPGLSQVAGGGFADVVFEMAGPKPTSVIDDGDLVMLSEQGGNAGQFLYAGIVEDVRDTYDNPAIFEVQLTHVGSELGDADVELAYTQPVDVASIVRSAIQATAHLTFDVYSIPDTGILAPSSGGDVTFSNTNALDVLNTCQTICGVGYFWAVDAVGKVFFQSYASGPNYTVARGVNYSKRTFTQPIGKLKNSIRILGGTPPGGNSALVADYVDAASIAQYGRRSVQPPYVFPRITDQATLTAMVNAIGASMNRRIRTVTVTLPSYSPRVTIAQMGGAQMRYWEPSQESLVESDLGSGGYSPTYVVTKVDLGEDGITQTVTLMDVPVIHVDTSQQTAQSINRAITTPPNEVGAGVGSVNGATGALELTAGPGINISEIAPGDFQISEQGDEDSAMSNVMTDVGDMIVGGAAGAPQRLAIGTAGSLMTVENLGNFAETILELNPSAYYRLNEAAGTTMADGTTNGHNGTYNGSGVTYHQAPATGDGDFAVLYDGAAGFSTAPSSTIPSGDFSLAFFFKTTQTPGTGAMATLIGNGSGSGNGFSIGIANGAFGQTAGQLVIGETGSGGRNWLAHTTSVFNDNAYHFVVAVRTAATDIWTLYVDGVAVALTNSTSQPDNMGTYAGQSMNAGGNLLFAKSNQSTFASILYNGDLDEVAPFSFALTAIEVSNLESQSAGVASAFEVWRTLSQLGLISDPGGSEGALFYKSGGIWSFLPVGGVNTVLHGGTDPSYSAVVPADMTGPGDTTKFLRGDNPPTWAVPPGMSNPMTTQDDIIIGGAAGAPARLGKGSNGWVLTVDSSTGHVVWAAASSGFANPMTTAADIIVGGTGGTPARLAKGTDGQVLTVDPTTHLLVWATPSSGFADPTTTKGDLIVHGSSTTRLGVGADGSALQADSAQSLGVRWVTPTQRPLVDPTGLSWSWINQGVATIATQGAALQLASPAEAADNWHFRAKTLPSKPYTVIVHMLGAYLNVAYPGVCVGWLRTSDNHFAVFDQRGDVTAVGQVESSYSTAPFGLTANYVTQHSIQMWDWIKIHDDATNRQVSISRDGYNWILLHSVATNDQITPDRLIFGLEARNASFGATLTLDSWEEF